MIGLHRSTGTRVSPGRWAALALFAAALPSAAGAADPILSRVPARAEALIVVDVRRLAGDEGLRTMLAEPRCVKIKRALDKFKQISGIDAQKDLDRVAAIGLIDDDDMTAIAFEGKIDDGRITGLLALNENYETSTVLGTTVHKWRDGQDDRNKVLAFFPGTPTVAIMANSAAAMEAVLEAGRAGGGGGSALAVVPEGAGGAAMWAAMVKPARDTKLTGPFEAVRARAATVVADLTADRVATTVTLTMESGVAAKDGVQAVEGLIALGRLQKKMPLLATVASGFQVRVGAAPETIVVTGGVERETVVPLAVDRLCRR